MEDSRMSSDEDELAGFYDAIVILLKLFAVTGVFCAAAMMIASSLVFVVTVWRGDFNKLPMKIRVTIILNLLLLIGCCFLAAVSIISAWQGVTFMEFRSEFKAMIIFVSYLWTGIHWQFTAYYMQSACLMRITFR